MKVTALTYRDYAALPDDGRRYQVLDGELCVAPAPNTRHQAISLELSSALHVHVTQHRLGRVFAAPTDVMHQDDPDLATIVQPDVLFIATDRLGIISTRGIEGAPTLAVEILSPGTASTGAASASSTRGTACRSTGSSMAIRRRSRCTG